MAGLFVLWNRGSSLLFLLSKVFYDGMDFGCLIFYFSIEKKEKAMCCMRALPSVALAEEGRNKKHDIKNCRREGERRGKKDRASFEEREAGIFCPGEDQPKGWKSSSCLVRLLRS